MKAREFVTETADLKNKLSQWFHADDIISVEPASARSDGSVSLLVRGSLRMRGDVHLDKFPVDIKKLTGSMVIHHDCGITDLRGFPEDIGGDLMLINMPSLTSLASDRTIVSGSGIMIEKSGIKNLSGAKMQTPLLSIQDNEDLESLEGSGGVVTTAFALGNNPNLSDMKLVTRATNSGDHIYLETLDFPKLKLCQLIAMDTKKVLKFEWATRRDESVDICKKYQGQGPRAYVPLLNELKDAGFGELAKRG